MKRNKYPIILIGIGFLLILFVVIMSTGHSIEELFTSSTAKLPTTSQPVCNTVMVLYQESPQPLFGISSIPIMVTYSWNSGIVNSWEFADILSGEVGEIFLSGKAVTLASNTISSSGINTVEFGNIRISAQGLSCTILLVTPDQYDSILKWLLR